MDQKRVMIIDDDDEVRTLMGQQLEMLYDVVKCSSGENALEILEKIEDADKMPQLILLDISMKGMDGYDIAVVYPASE